MSCSDIPNLMDLQKAKLNIDDLGRLMGTGTGVSTNEVTGQVRPTYNAVMANLGYTRVGTFATGATLLNGRQTLLWDVANGGDGQEYGWSGSFPLTGKVVPPGSTPLTTGGIAVGAWMSRFDPEIRTQVYELQRRSYADVGYNVVGTFQGGFTIVSVNDVGIDETTGKGYTGPVGSIAAGTSPLSGGFTDRSTQINLTFDTVAKMQTYPAFVVGQRVEWNGYYTASDGGGNWGVVKSGVHVADGGSIFSINSSLYVEANLKGCRISVLKFGAKGDFNPDTGTGTTNLTFIQNAINYTQKNGGGVVYFPTGNYFLGSSYKPGENINLVINILVGSITSKGLPFVYGVHLKGANANLYAGNTGRMVHFARAKKCSISGIGFYHYTGGPNSLVKALSSNCIRVSDSCEDIDIYRNYIANYLAWGIDILSDAEDPSSSRYMVKNIRVYNNTIKTRRGDGKWMASGWQDGTNDGTGGGWCIAIINGEDISINNNVLYGKIDLENNEVGQTFYNISITNNDFRSGWVTPQLVVPSPDGKHWYDEPTNPRGLVGAQEIRQGIYHVGVGLNNRSTNIVAQGNTFEKGHILFWQKYALKVIGNNFRQGRIEVGYVKSGTEQITQAPVIIDNTSETRHSDFPSGAFIGLMGLVPDAQIQRNSIENSDGFGVISEEQTVGNAISGSSGNFDGNYSKIEFPVAVGTYRLFVNPLLTPVVEVDVSCFLYGGVGFATKKVYGGGWKKGAAVNSGYVVTASVTQGASITIGIPVEDSVGNFSLDIVVASSNGVVNVATTKGYANASIVKIA